MEILQQGKVSLSEKCSQMTWILLPPREEKDSLETAASARLRALSMKTNRCFYVNAQKHRSIGTVTLITCGFFFVKHFFISTHRLSLSVPLLWRPRQPASGLVMAACCSLHRLQIITGATSRLWVIALCSSSLHQGCNQRHLQGIGTTDSPAG